MHKDCWNIPLENGKVIGMNGDVEAKVRWQQGDEELVTRLSLRLNALFRDREDLLND
jgi:hypothetical protein